MEVEYWVVAVVVLVELICALNVALTLATITSFTHASKPASRLAPTPQVKESVIVEISLLLVPTVTEPLAEFNSDLSHKSGMEDTNTVG